jgi:acetamidase/formamidase
LHTTDVSGRSELEVNEREGLDLDGPLLLPNAEDLPDIAKPYTDDERTAGAALATEYDVDEVTETGPIQVIGSGATINDATENAFARAGALLDMSEGEVRARCTFTGGVEIARLPGVVQLSMLAPMDRLDDVGLGDVVRAQYGL